MSKRTALLLLGIISLGCSRGVFALINDPEGPNLVVVLALAAIIYAILLAAYILGSRAH